MPRDNYLKSVFSPRSCCEGHFCLLFPEPRGLLSDGSSRYQLPQLAGLRGRRSKEVVVYNHVLVKV